MVLAAGLGTRLRPLTNDRPKALVELRGRTMLENTLCRLRSFGIHDVIINAHHFADVMIEYLRCHDNFGMNVVVSREDLLLDTGGGLKAAAYFFTGSSEPFLLHNVDVLSNIDFEKMLTFHREHDALATLAMRKRAGRRQLLFDEHALLCGRRTRGVAGDEVVRPAGQMTPLAFSGIHVISPKIFDRMTEEGAFSIIDAYLRMTAQGEKIAAFRADEYYWSDLGTIERLRTADADIQSGLMRT
jgi:NDP-sugar pyrophosphorylase family protein